MNAQPDLRTTVMGTHIQEPLKLETKQSLDGNLARFFYFFLFFLSIEIKLSGALEI